MKKLFFSRRHIPYLFCSLSIYDLSNVLSMIWRFPRGWCDWWTLGSGVTTFHPIHHPVMDMGSQSLTAWGGVQMGLKMWLERDPGYWCLRGGGAEGVDGEKCVLDWGQGFICTTAGLWECLCEGLKMDFLTACDLELHHFILRHCLSAWQETTSLIFVKFHSWYLWTSDPGPMQMMSLVIRSSVTPFSKSCRGVMSLWGPLVSDSHWNEDSCHQSSEQL